MTPLGLRKKTGLCFIILVGVWLAGFVWFLQLIPTENNSPNDRRVDTADAIIVLTGGVGRLEYGLTLLAEKHAPVLFVSGAGENTSVPDLLHTLPDALQETLNTLPAGSIMLGHDAENTIGNAQETARWLAGTHYHHILLVTSNYHMPRSLVEFSALLPHITITPAPVFPDNLDLTHWWQQSDDRMLLLSEYHKYLASKLRHWFVSATHAA